MAYAFLTDQNKADIVARLQAALPDPKSAQLAAEAADYENSLRLLIAAKPPSAPFTFKADPALKDPAVILATEAGKLPPPTPKA